MKNEEEVKGTGKGKVKVADEVVAIIAGLAAVEIEGVAMSGGVVDGIAEMLRRKNLAKGVKVEVGEKETAVDMNIVVAYGTTIPDIAEKIQDSVAKSITSMTGLKVLEVNVNVQGVYFEETKEEKEEKEKERKQKEKEKKQKEEDKRVK